MATVSTHDVGLEALDGLEQFDALCLFVSEDERPLRGIAGYVDWRMCGGLSRIIKNGFFVGAAQDWLLVPAHGRLPLERIFVVGLGKKADLTADGVGKALSVAARTLSRAKVDAVALEIPGGALVNEAQRAQLFSQQFLPEFKGRKVALLAEKTLAKQVPAPASSSRAGP